MRVCIEMGFAKEGLLGGSASRGVCLGGSLPMRVCIEMGFAKEGLRLGGVCPGGLHRGGLLGGLHLGGSAWEAVCI